MHIHFYLFVTFLVFIPKPGLNLNARLAPSVIEDLCEPDTSYHSNQHLCQQEATTAAKQVRAMS